MRHFVLLLSFIGQHLLYCQTPTEIWNISLCGFSANYAYTPWQKSAFSKQPLNGFQFGVGHKVNRWFWAGGSLQLAPKQQVRISSMGTAETGLTDISVWGTLCSERHRMWSAEAKVHPVLATGLGGMLVSGHVAAYVPVTGGLRVNLVEHISLSATYTYKMAFSQLLLPRQMVVFGFNALFFKEIKSKQYPAPLPDTDGDGVADLYDDCPHESGSRQLHGCPGLATDNADPLYIDAGRNIPEDQILGQDSLSLVRQHDQLLLRQLSRQVRYGAGSAEVDVRYSNILKEIITILNRNPECSLKINGYTDSSGDQKQDVIIAAKRAHIMKIFLTENLDISPQKIATEGRGALEPVSDNETEAGRALNRRVEFLLICP